MSFSDSYEALATLGFTPFFRQQHLALEPATLPERVIAEQRGEYRLLGTNGERRGVLAGTFRHRAAPDGYPAVGDWILTDAEGSDPGRVIHVFERMTRFARKRAGFTSHAQVVAANVDLAIVVAAFSAPEADRAAEQHALNPRRLERYLRAIADSGARPLIAVNKADLFADADSRAEELSVELGGVDVCAVSAQSGNGIEALLERLARGETAALVGVSGVGKSSLTNRLLGLEVQRVNDIREDDARGRHTTTGRQMFTLPGGGFVIDTPGMRELALFADAETDTSATHFDEIDRLGEGCRFRDCRHEEEPGCAVRAAVGSGAIDEARLQHSHKLRRELEWQSKRHDALFQQELLRQRKVHARGVRASLKRKGRSD
jgi:ribosome biogenesis GTPase / thiamine phosphate phosphatase